MVLKFSAPKNKLKKCQNKREAFEQWLLDWLVYWLWIYEYESTEPLASLTIRMTIRGQSGPGQGGQEQEQEEAIGFIPNCSILNCLNSLI